MAHPVSVTHTCMNESLELSLLCSVHTATVVYIGTYRTLCIHLQPVQQRGHHKQAIASLAALVLGRPQVLVSVGHGRDNRHSCYFCMCECQGDTVSRRHSALTSSLHNARDPVRICIGVCPVRMPPAILLTGVTPPPPMFTRYSPS